MAHPMSNGWRLPKYWSPTPPPHRPASVHPPPLVRGEDKLDVWKGVGVNILEDDRHCAVLYVRKYFVATNYASSIPVAHQYALVMVSSCCWHPTFCFCHCAVAPLQMLASLLLLRMSWLWCPHSAGMMASHLLLLSLCCWYLLILASLSCPHFACIQSSNLLLSSLCCWVPAAPQYVLATCGSCGGPPESVATLPPFGPIERQKWFDQISSQWESQRNRFALIYYGKNQFLPPCIWNIPFMAYRLWICHCVGGEGF